MRLRPAAGQRPASCVLSAPASWIAASVLAVATGSGAVAQNAIVAENQLPGTPAAVWYDAMPGDANIQGFATDISVDRGQTVHFKIATDAAAYHIDVYRLGWYQGLGARLVGHGVITAGLPQIQPAPLYDAATAMTDCGNWAESAHWDVPANAVSGVYLAKLVRDGAVPGVSHITFVVRDDASTSDVLCQTSDATWQAYNVYGGASLYPALGGHAPGFNHATKVSYNRPFDIRHSDGSPGDDVFAAEYAMLRFLEANGFDVRYATCVDSDRQGARILQHRLFLSVGHDEYWSAGQRANVTAARDAGVHLAFFSGNEVYWKVRYEPSIDGTATPYRTLVCYKEGALGENGCGSKCDPSPQWTGLWRDGCAPTYPGTDACVPESLLTGQFGWDGTIGAIQVPDTFKNLRLWRNTSVALLGPGQTATLGASSLGSEWDWEHAGVAYPSRRMLLSATQLNGRTHHLSLYRADSGALVFGAGTIQWPWGLDAFHTFQQVPTNADMQQATVNLFADFGAFPGSLQPGLVPAGASGDHQAPTSAITAPGNGAQVGQGQLVVVQGTAVDTGGGVVAGVEVSVDGGATWHAATGTGTWTYAWSPAVQGAAVVRCRAFDDSLNVQPLGGPGSPSTVTVTVTPPVCPCTVFGAAEAPASGLVNDGSPLELGMKFRVDVAGAITALRFYKPAGAQGAHLGNLWTGTGTNLAQVAFSETASGWQQVALVPPVSIAANTTYVVSYFSPSGDYGGTPDYFTQQVGFGPVHGLADGADGPNGLFRYTVGSAFPSQGFRSSNYYADVVFAPGPDTTPPTVVAVAPTNGATGVATGIAVRATCSEALAPATVGSATFALRDAQNAPVPATVSYEAGTFTAVLTPSAPLAPLTAYTATLRGGAAAPHVTDLSGNALAADFVWSFTTGAAARCPCTVFAGTGPASGRSNDGSSIDVGMRLQATVPGTVTALRYFKAAGTTGVHVGSLWSNGGVLLAQQAFGNETASGWQETLLPTPVAIAAGTTYVVSVHSPSGDYVSTLDQFQQPSGTGLVRGLQDGFDGSNGVFRYSAVPVFPTQSFRSSNYWTDVVFFATGEARAEAYGAGCPGTGGQVPTLTAAGQPAVPTQPNATFALSLANSLPQALAAVVAGNAEASRLPCALLVGGISASWLAVTSNGGSATFGLPIPAAPPLLGLPLWLQGAVFDPAATGSFVPGLALTPALRLAVGH